MPKKTIRKNSKSSKKISLRTLWSVLAVALAIFVVTLITSNFTDQSSSPIPAPFMQPAWIDFNNESYDLGNNKVSFMHGEFIPDGLIGHKAILQNQSLSPSGTRGAAIIMDNPGGSGEFYFVVGAALKNGRQTLSDPMPLGDRIKIVSVKVEDPESQDNGQIVVTYLDRAPNAPMATAPTIQKVAKYSFTNSGDLIRSFN